MNKFIELTHARFGRKISVAVDKIVAYYENDRGTASLDMLGLDGDRHSFSLCTVTVEESYENVKYLIGRASL